MTISQAIAKRIRDLLVEKNMTQYKLGIDMAIHHGTMMGIMSAKHKGANIRTIFLICKGLGVTPEEFFADPMFTGDMLDFE